MPFDIRGTPSAKLPLVTGLHSMKASGEVCCVQLPCCPELKCFVCYCTASLFLVADGGNYVV